MSEIITPNKTIVDFKGKAVAAEEPKQEQKPTQYQKSKDIASYVLYRMLMKSMKVELLKQIKQDILKNTQL